MTRGAPTWRVYATVSTVAVFVYLLLPTGTVQDAAYAVIGAGGVAAMAYGIVRRRPQPALPWLLFGAGVVLMLGGDIAWLVYDRAFGRSAPLAIGDDAFYLTAYPLLVAGLALLSFRLTPRRDLDAWLDAALVALALGLVSVDALTEPLAGRTGSSWAATAVEFTYPLLDLALLVALAPLLLTLSLRRPSVRAIGAATLVLLAGDVVYAHQGSAYRPGGWVDVFWLGFYVCAAAAALHPSIAEPRPTVLVRRSARRRFALVVGLILASMSMLVAEAWMHRPSDAELAFGLVLAPLFVVRTWLLVAELDSSEKWLRRSEQRLAAVLDNAPEGIVVVGADGLVIDGNPALFALTGLTRDDLIGTPFVRFIHPDDLEAYAAEFVDSLATGRGYSSRERRWLDANGNVVWTLASVAIVDDEETGERFVIGQLLDISRRREAETARARLLEAERTARVELAAAHLRLAEQNEQLLESDRFKSELIGVVSHDLRTPLTSIIGFVDVVLEGDAGPVNDEQRHFLEIAARNSQRLLRLVNDLLFVSRAEAGALQLDHERIDLTALVGDCVSNLAQQAEDGGLQLRLDADGPVFLVADAHRLSEVVENLLSNALKFTPSGGRVDVRIGRRPRSAVLEVADTGIGIGDADQQHLFERFFRSEHVQSVAGAGLGLSITKAIVDAHGGTIEVDSRSGEGTTFTVSLPLRPPAHNGGLEEAPRALRRGPRAEPGLDASAERASL